jgi:hypothetical protein
MAGYKRTSYSPTKSTRITRTQSNAGGCTESTSFKSSPKGPRVTHTTKKNGARYTTETKKLADGYYERKRVYSYNPKKHQRTKVIKAGPEYVSPKFLMWLGIFILVVYISNLF